MDSERHPPSRAGGTPAEQLLALLETHDRDRRELGGLLGWDEHRVGAVLGPLEDAGKIVSEDGRVSLASPPEAPAPRRSRSSEHLLLGAARRAAIADGLAEVAVVRARLLSGELLEAAQVPAWLEEEAKRGEPLDAALGYAGPEDTVARWMPSTAELEPLRYLSEHLAHRYGWHPANATVYALTGVAPVNGVRITTRYTLPDTSAPVRWTVDFDADEDAEVVAKEIRRRQREHDIQRRPKSADAKRLARLASFVARHGTGEHVRQLWNTENPADRYPQSPKLRPGRQESARRLSRICSPASARWVAT